MTCQTLAFAALVAALPTFAFAQDDKARPKGDKPASLEDVTPQDPKTKEHDALKTFAGNWDVNFKMTGADGEEPMVSKGSEHAQLVCNGLWLKATSRGEFQGQPHAGLWLMGYDPHQKAYHGVCVDSHDASPAISQGRYDEKTKTWKFSGSNAKGKFDMTCVVKSPDQMTETGTCTQDGKEHKIEVTRTRAKTAQTSEASMELQKPSGKEYEPLAKMVGQWDAVMKMAMAPGQPPQEMKGTETVVPVCGGKFLWSDFRMEFMGQPFEGHALYGYDPLQKKYVSFWIDSMHPTLSQSSGSYDAASKSITLSGKSRDHAGQPTTTKETSTWKDDNTRLFKMESTGADGPHGFEITYTRRKN
jgi:hypothetical protein